MDRIAITGGYRLEGEIPISGAKNAALPLMCASLLTKDPFILSNLPQLADISTLKLLLKGHGVKPEVLNLGKPLEQGQTISFTTEVITSTVAPYDIVRKMRASILVLGPLLARMGEATVSLPGGCAIGNRPIDLHLKGFEEMGAKIELEDGYVRAVAPGGRLKGGIVHFPIVSVGATENIQDVSHAVESVCEAESNRLESELSMVRYIAWAIPSIGFIGTVRGIGQALANAHLAVQGDIASVTASLGVAFNSTFIALLISIIIMFLMHQLQLLQDRLVLDVHGYCDRRLIRHLRSA